MIGADKAQPLVASIEELFQGLGVAIFSQNPVELRHQQVQPPTLLPKSYTLDPIPTIRCSLLPSYLNPIL